MAGAGGHRTPQAVAAQTRGHSSRGHPADAGLRQDGFSQRTDTGDRARRGGAVSESKSSGVAISAAARTKSGWNNYSYRRASTGSRRAALLAGQMPKKRPMPTLTPMPRATAQIGTAVGSEGKIARVTRDRSSRKASR